MFKKESGRFHPAIKITLLYLLFSSIWILAGDELVYRKAGNNAEANQFLQNLKGITFVLLSGFFLYYISFTYFKNLQKTLDKKAALLRKLDLLIDATVEGIIEYDFKSDTAVLNDQMKTFMGFTDNIITNFTQIDSAKIHPEDRLIIQNNFNKYLSENRTKWYSEYRYKINNEYRNVISQGLVLRNEEGDPVQMIYVLKDVTEIKKAQEKIAEQQAIFRKTLALSAIEAQETERNRWALELHDNICQMLAVSKMYMEVGLNNSDNKSVITLGKAILEDAINEIRTISYNIKPPQFDLLTLSDSIRLLVSNIQRFSGFNFIMDFNEEHEKSLKNEHKLMIYRIIQEQLNNIIKYSGASEIFLGITVENGWATVIIRDDGLGFDPNEIQNGIGLNNIRNRLQAFSGNLEINAAPGKGVELIADFNVGPNTI